MNSKNLLDVSHYSLDLKVYQDTFHILDDISFSLRKGEVLGIVGESGCGKSMLANSIMGLYPANVEKIDGDISFKDTNLTTLSDAERHKVRGKNISMIVQSPSTSLNPVISIGKQMVNIIRTHEKVTKKVAKEQSISWLDKVQLKDAAKVFDSYPHQLSGGMQQRVVIAMALSCNAELVVADEPTTALDVTTQLEILNLIKEMQRENDLSLIIVTHDFGVAKYMCDRIMVMYAGQVAEIGTTNQVMNDPTHPYTEALLKSLPKDGEKIEDIYEIPGTVPKPNNFNSGCRFFSRCQYATEKCESQKPPLEAKKGTPDHSFACFNPPKEKVNE